MAQPSRYERKKDFAADFGNETDHAAINAELDRAAVSINGIRTNLARIQRDDGGLVQGIVTADSVDPGFADELSGNVASGVQGALDDAKASALAATLAANAAETARNTAASSATSVATSASAAASSASSAALSAGNSTTKANEAAASAASAAASKDASAASAAGAASSTTNAAVAATNADIAASNAATSANNAANSATNAANSASNAEASAAASSSAYDDFDRRFLGAKGVNPSLDNDGQPLQTSALYWNTSSKEMRLWTGTAWATVTSGIPNDLSVTTAKLANGVLSADAAGRAKVATGFLTQAMIGANVAGTGPAFEVFTNGSQSLSSGIETKVQFGSPSRDTHFRFSAGRYTPNVPGYYVITYSASLSASSLTFAVGTIGFNGSGTYRGASYSGPAIGLFCTTGSCVRLFNGSTDYVEVFIHAGGTNPAVEFGYFSGVMMRTA